MGAKLHSWATGPSFNGNMEYSECVRVLREPSVTDYQYSVLLPDALLSPSTPAAIFITDHELSHLSTPIFDLAQMCAELHMLTYFKSIPAGREILTAFIEGYGLIEEDKRWRILIYIGCHLICWGSRTAGWGTVEQVEGCVELGRDLVVNGWERNREWCMREGWAFLIED